GGHFAPSGWLEAQFSAPGVPFRERGRRTDESIALLRALWSQDPVTFKPRYWATQIEEMRMQPPPSAPIPLWVGGSSEKALERAVKLCDGWHGSRLTAEAAAPVIKRLHPARRCSRMISHRPTFIGRPRSRPGKARSASAPQTPAARDFFRYNRL